MIKSIGAYFKAISLIFKLNLGKALLIPVLISLAVGSLILFSSYGLSDNLGYYIGKIWVWDFGKSFFQGVSNFLGGLIVLALGMIVYKHIVMAAAAPFMSPVAEKVMNHLNPDLKTNEIKISFGESLMRGIRVNVRNLLIELGLTIPLLLFSLIPVVGIVFVVLIFLIQAYYAGFGNMDYTLERFFKYKQSIVFVRDNKWRAIGNGSVFMLITMIPFVGFLFCIPLGAVAATVALADRVEEGQKQMNLIAQ
ncbi:EI24 domain-containing protein [Aureivirga sp. CE67]|uniref:EI24 domain-containing protein n=1 Tax=Aureivirga sp. CE67 TaxID=1788983 RepID=UPI0018CBA272|nr:EI24 domain-containing protein [Aureivirga sp. CE67]